MTVLKLQDALIEDVKETLKDMITQDVSGNRVTGVKVFAQQLPVISSNERDTSRFLPYAVVKILDAQTEEDIPWSVTTGIYFGVRDAGRENQGHKHIMVMIERVTDRFISDPLLDNRYWAQQDIQWELDSEDHYPHFFGGVCINFSVPKIGRREPIYD